MITQKTKRVALISGVLFLVVCAVVAWSVRVIIVESRVLSEQVAALEVDRSQQSALSRLQKLTQDTAPEREELRSYFLASQSDSIDFLNYVETLANNRGLSLVTIDPKEIKLANETFLAVGYELEGSLGQVESFIELLEAIPYVSQLQSVRLRQQSAVLWQADVTIAVRVLTYEQSN